MTPLESYSSKNRHASEGPGASLSCRNLAKNCFREAMESNIQECIQFSNYRCFRLLALTGYNFKTKQEGNNKLEMHSEINPH